MKIISLILVLFVMISFTRAYYTNAEDEFGLSDSNLNINDESDLANKNTSNGLKQKSKKSDPEAEKNFDDSSSKKIIQIKGSFGFQYTSHSLSSATLSSTLNASRGNTFHLDADFTPKETMFSGYFRYRRNTTEYEQISGVTPNAITYSKNEFFAGALINPFQSSENAYYNNFRFGLGYYYINRVATQTNPNPILTDYKWSGPSLLSRYRFQFTDTVDLQSMFYITLPTSFLESSKTTGSYSSGYLVDYEISIGYAISKFIVIDFSPYIQYQNINFNGTGTRGTVNASEKTTIIGLPIGLRLHF